MLSNLCAEKKLIYAKDRDEKPARELDFFIFLGNVSKTFFFLLYLSLPINSSSRSVLRDIKIFCVPSIRETISCWESAKKKPQKIKSSIYWRSQLFFLPLQVGTAARSEKSVSNVNNELDVLL
jgi:hypothetical protein